mmetsp:Transcript_12864/g.12671  ORF Transcript_12864/g.12671 Transcript_12864/m.12671 type:complete len:106 (+) Transcript_12864:849-1166(+)
MRMSERVVQVACLFLFLTRRRRRHQTKRRPIGHRTRKLHIPQPEVGGARQEARHGEVLFTADLSIFLIFMLHLANITPAVVVLAVGLFHEVRSTEVEDLDIHGGG